METDVYRLISHPLQDPSTLRGGLAIHKKIAGKCRRPFSDPPGDLIDRWEHRDGRGRAPRANGSDIPFSAISPIPGAGKGLSTVISTFYIALSARGEGRSEGGRAIHVSARLAWGWGPWTVDLCHGAKGVWICDLAPCGEHSL